jgi:hypothetical protein
MVDQARSLSKERVEDAMRIFTPQGHPPALADGTRAENGAYYALYNAAMIFGYVPHTRGSFQAERDYVANLTDDRRSQILRRIVEVLTGMHRSLRETPIGCIPPNYPRCTDQEEVLDSNYNPTGRMHRIELRKAFTSASLSGASSDTEGTRTIYLCPQNFQPLHNSDITLTESFERDLVHESAHIAGVVAVPEQYCVYYDCDSACHGDDMADAWMHLVACMSGHKGRGPH